MSLSRSRESGLSCSYSAHACLWVSLTGGSPPYLALPGSRALRQHLHLRAPEERRGALQGSAGLSRRLVPEDPCQTEVTHSAPSGSSLNQPFYSHYQYSLQRSLYLRLVVLFYFSSRCVPSLSPLLYFYCPPPPPPGDPQCVLCC